MSIKIKSIIAYVFVFIPIIAIIGFFSMRTDAPVTNFFIIFSLVTVLERICLRMERLFFSYYYKKYLSVLNKELNPEKFLKLTDREFKSSRNRRYKNYMKLNYVRGHLALDEIQKAHNYLMLTDLSDKKYGLPADMRLLYYYDLALVFYRSNKKEEALKVYEKNILPNKDTLSSGRKNREMKRSIRFLEAFLFDEDNVEKMIQGLNESLENVKIRKNIIERKYFLGTYKEKNGNIDEAKKLYKEVVKKGNKLVVTDKARINLKNIENDIDKNENNNKTEKNSETKNENKSSDTGKFEKETRKKKQAGSSDVLKF